MFEVMLSGNTNYSFRRYFSRINFNDVVTILGEILCLG